MEAQAERKRCEELVKQLAQTKAEADERVKAAVEHLQTENQRLVQQSAALSKSETLKSLQLSNSSGRNGGGTLT